MFTKKWLPLFCLLLNVHILFAQAAWKKLENTVPYKGKQDDIFFINPNTGWYVNGSGKIYKTSNGGENWTELISKPGTYFRCIGFIDSLTGFAGNIGTEYFPGVTDTVPLYKTTDGGKTWLPVNYNGPTVKGLCAIDILKVPYINAGVTDYKYHIHAAGRVGSPAFLLTSTDAGQTWNSMDMNKYCGAILDIKFFNTTEGFICAGSDVDFEKTNALILYTKDGGKTWEKTYQSNRPYEITWKCSFPTRETGYVTIQNYNPDSTVTQRYVAKTTNGGKTWKEIKLTNDYTCNEFGVGFADEKYGWVGTRNSGYETNNGGKTWKMVDMGKAANKIRILKEGGKIVGYSIGLNVYKIIIDR